MGSREREPLSFAVFLRAEARFSLEQISLVQPLGTSEEFAK